MGNRRPEQGHNAVAQDLIHRALVAVHRLHQGAQGGAEELTPVFRLNTLDQLRGTLDIGKQHGDLLAFTFQVATRLQNLLSEVLGSVCLRSYEARRCSGSSLHRLPAFEAKLGARRQLGVTPGTHQHQTGAALQAKLRLRRIFLLTLEALHTETPLSRLRPRTRRLIGDSSPLTTASQGGEDDINRRLVRHTRSTNLP